tara:strand:+ start:334 stop:540 length:207 start_codon:yes stop_codon:yes gene_type:complete
MAIFLDYQIAQLKKQLVKLELKKAMNKPKKVPQQKEIFFICDEQEDFCIGSKKLLSKHLCPDTCCIVW